MLNARISLVSSLKRGECGYNSYNCIESTPTNQNSSPSNGFNNMHYAFSSYMIIYVCQKLEYQSMKFQIEVFFSLSLFKTLNFEYLFFFITI